MPHLVANLPGGQNQSGRALSEETVVSVLSTLVEVLGTSLEAAKTLRASQGIERLVLINKDGLVEEFGLTHFFFFLDFSMNSKLTLYSQIQHFLKS